MLVRWGIRLAAALVGIAAGILICSAALDGFSVTAVALVEATLVFWLVHLVLQFVALRLFVRDPSLALAALLALASTIVSLIIANLIVGGLNVGGGINYLLATLIIWVTTAIGDVVGQRMVRQRRRGNA